MVSRGMLNDDTLTDAQWTTLIKLIIHNNRQDLVKCNQTVEMIQNSDNEHTCNNDHKQSNTVISHQKH